MDEDWRIPFNCSDSAREIVREGCVLSCLALLTIFYLFINPAPWHTAICWQRGRRWEATISKKTAISPLDQLLPNLAMYVSSQVDTHDIYCDNHNLVSTCQDKHTRVSSHRRTRKYQRQRYLSKSMTSNFLSHRESTHQFHEHSDFRSQETPKSYALTDNSHKRDIHSLSGVWYWTLATRSSTIEYTNIRHFN